MPLRRAQVDTARLELLLEQAQVHGVDRLADGELHEAHEIGLARDRRRRTAGVAPARERGEGGVDHGGLLFLVQ